MRARLIGIAALSAAIALPTAMVGAATAAAAPRAVVSAQALGAARDARSVVNTVAPQTLAAVRAAANNKGKVKGQAKATIAANPKIDETCGLDVTLTLDSSGSIGTNANNVKNAATDFAAALKNTNSTMRITRFSKTSSQLAARVPVNDVTTGPGGSLANGIDAYPIPTGGTNWQDAFNFTKPGTGDSMVPELLIFVTDGDPTLWGPTGTGGTGQGTASNIADSLAQAIPAANSVKTQPDSRTRVLMVGVGNGVDNAGSRQRMAQVSGPNIVTSSTGLVGKSINDVDVAAFADFKALGTFLRSVVTSLCGNGVTVQKLAQTADGTEYVPATGWNVTVKPTVSGGFSWVDPAGQPADTAATKNTAGEQGAAAFKWKPKQPSNGASVRISEDVKPGFTASNWECEIRSSDGQTVTKKGSLVGGVGFDIDMKSSDVAACKLFNNFVYAPGIDITKVANDDPVRGNAAGWNETYSYEVKNTGNAPLSVAKPVDNKCTAMSAPSGPGATDPNPRLAPGKSWTYNCINKITAATTTSPVTWNNQVVVTGTAPNSKTVTDNADESVDVKTPAIDIVKTAKKTESGTPIPKGGSVPAGTRVTYIYTLRNTGNDAVKDVQITDDTCSPVTRTSGSGTSLGVGQTWVYECTKVINPPSSEATVDNTVTATANWSGYSPSGQNNAPVRDTDTFEIKVDRSASLSIIKSTEPGAVNQDFAFTMDGQGVPTPDKNFVLNASAQGNPASIRAELDGPDGLGSVYTVTETAATGWDLTAIECTKAPESVNLVTGEVKIKILPKEDVTCAYTNSRRPTLTIEKQTTPAGATESFGFTTSRPAPLAQLTPLTFTLSDNQERRYNNVPVGRVTITEDVIPAGWSLDEITCSGADIFSEDVPNGEITLDLAYGDQAHCVYTNAELPPATLTVVKSGTPESAPGTNFDFRVEGDGLFSPGDFGFDNFQLEIGESKAYSVRPLAGGDLYTVDETASDPSFELTDIRCFRASNPGVPILGNIGTGVVNVTLTPGDSAICTYTNERLPTLTITKQVINPADPVDNQAFDFTSTGLSTPSFTLRRSNPSREFPNLAAGAAITVTEVAPLPTDWTRTSLQCTGPGAGGLTANLTTGVVTGSLGYGADVTCTYVNTKRTPASSWLYVVKDTDPEASPQAFNFTATGTNINPNPPLNRTFQLTGGDFDGFEVFPEAGPGNVYTVTEAGTAGWDLTDIECVLASAPGTPVGVVTGGRVQVRIPEDDIAVCVYTNQERGSLKVTKLTDIDTPREFDFTATPVTPANFTLATTESRTFGNIAAGTVVRVTEDIPTDAPDRWDLAQVTCTGNAVPEIVNLLTGQLQVTVGPGEVVECAYVDRKVPNATVKVVKAASPADGTQFDFTAAGADGGVLPADQSFTLAPDGGTAEKDLVVYPSKGGESFTFAEPTVPVDWKLTDIQCTNNGVDVGTPIFNASGGLIDVDIDPGDTLTCTFTDREDATLTVIKHADDDPGLDFDFSWNAGLPSTFSLRDGQSREATGLPPGAYEVSEVDLPTDWFLDGANGEHPECTGTAAPVVYGPANVNGAALTIAAGEHVVCAFSDFFDYRPAIQLDKSASAAQVVKGGTVNYTYVMTNTGNVDVTPIGTLNQIVVDDKCSPVTYVGGDGGNEIMEPGEVWTFECNGYVINQDTLNTATATMRDNFGEDVTSTDTEFVEELVPGMELLKTASQTVAYPGTQVTYTYLLRNTGNAPLQNQTSPSDRNAWMSDDKCSPVTYVSGDTGDDNILGVGEAWQYTCAATLTVTTKNVATATTTPLDPSTLDPVGGPITSTDDETVSVIKGGITLAKSATAPGGVMKDGVLLVPVGTTVTYNYEVTSGEATVGMQVLDMSDDKCSPVDYVSGDTNSNGLVDPGETWRYRCQTTFQGATTTTNVATVTAVEPALGQLSTATATAKVRSFKGSIALDKMPSAELVRKGSSVTYTYRATNDGTEDLSNIAVTDDKCSPVNYVSGDDGDRIMKPGETWVYECSMTLAVTTTNIAVVTGTTSIGGTVDATDSAQVQIFNPANLDAKIKVKKTANKKTVNKGGKVTYTYKVSNPGKVGLAKVKKHVTDNKCSRVKYIKGDKDGNGILTSARSGGESAAEVWTFRCKTKLKKNTVNTVTAKGKGWLKGEIVGPTVKDKAKAKVLVIQSGGGGGRVCKHHALGWALATRFQPDFTASAVPKWCKQKGLG